MQHCIVSLQQTYFLLSASKQYNKEKQKDKEPTEHLKNANQGVCL